MWRRSRTGCSSSRPRASSGAATGRTPEFSTRSECRTTAGCSTRWRRSCPTGHCASGCSWTIRSACSASSPFARPLVLLLLAPDPLRDWDVLARPPDLSHSRGGVPLVERRAHRHVLRRDPRHAAAHLLVIRVESRAGDCAHDAAPGILFLLRDFRRGAGAKIDERLARFLAVGLPQVGRVDAVEQHANLLALEQHAEAVAAVNAHYAARKIVGVRRCGAGNDE